MFGAIFFRGTSAECSEYMHPHLNIQNSFTPRRKLQQLSSEITYLIVIFSTLKVNNMDLGKVKISLQP